jgi:hypothetical protein
VANIVLNRVSAVWFALVAATFISWELGHGVGFQSSRLASCAVIAIAFLKARYVIMDFMEIRHAPRYMRLIGEIWPIAICLILIALFLR